MMLQLPIYYTEHFKTKPSKTFLVGINWFRNAHHFAQNNVKQHYHQLVADQLLNPVSFNKFIIDYHLYYKSPVCDPSNIIALIEKFTLDALKLNNIIPDDNVNCHIGSSYLVVGQDKINPRVEIAIKEYHVTD